MDTMFWKMVRMMIFVHYLFNPTIVDIKAKDCATASKEYALDLTGRYVPQMIEQ